MLAPFSFFTAFSGKEVPRMGLLGGLVIGAGATAAVCKAATEAIKLAVTYTGIKRQKQQPKQEKK